MMNKAFALLSLGLTLAVSAFASNALLPGSINFDDPALWGKTVVYGLDDNGNYNGVSHWYYESEDGSNSRVDHLAGTSTGYLMVGTAGSLHRTIQVSEPNGPAVNAGMRLTGDGIYMDTMVMLSAFQRPELAEPSKSGLEKLSCWARANADAGVTNFVVTAGYRDGEGKLSISNYTTTVSTDTDFSVAHRLTIRAMLAADGASTIFEVYLDGERVVGTDGTDVFPSMSDGVPGVADGATLYSLGFGGAGTADMINFTKLNPFDNPDYDQADLSMLQQCADIRVTGYSQAYSSLLNFPLLVRISEDRIENFRYSRCKPGGRDLRFTDASGNLVPCEVDTWNPNGESLVWVKIPYFLAGVTLRMHWDLKEGHTAPPNDSTKVWNDYIAVWHMTEAGSGSYAKDSTGHGYTARMSTGKFYAASTAPIGVAGYAPRVNKTSDASLNARCYRDDLDPDGGFTFTGWYLAQDYTEYPVGPFAGTKWKPNTNTSLDDQFGWGARCNSATTLRMNGNGSTGAEVSSPDDFTEHWFHISLVKHDAKLGMYFNGNRYSDIDAKLVETNRDFQLMLNGFCGDEIRIARVARSEDWIAAEYEMATNTHYLSMGPASAKGSHNFWLEEPSVSSQSVSPEEVDSFTFNIGRPRYGEVVVELYDSAGNRIEHLPPVMGSYQIVFSAVDARREPLKKAFYIVVCEDCGYSLIPDDDRVMLFNSDNTKDQEVRLQGYWDVDAKTNSVWYHAWDRWNGSGKFVEAGSHHVYYSPVDHRKLWELRHARLGNLFQDEDTLAERMNFLPWSTSACRYDDSAMPATRQRHAGTLILQNVSVYSGMIDPETGALDPAGIYSPLYTNGIGTIYFDAVNAYGGYRNELQIQIQREGDTEWQTWPADVFAVIDGQYSESNSVMGCESIVMDFDKAEGTTNWFYRVRASIDRTEPMHFRIIRTDKEEDNGWGTGGEDGEGLILIDNVIASSPAMGISLEQYGVPMSEGDRLLKGWRLAPFDVPFPTVGDKVHGRVKVNYIVNGTNRIDTSFVSLVTMWGRWRYLNQDMSEWKEYRLFPSGDDVSCFMTTEELPLDEAGDFEYYFMAVANAPYYSFHDYSGLAGWHWPDGFTESRSNLKMSAQTEGIYDDALPSPAYGKDFFIRLRDGQSNVERVEVVLGGASPQVLNMELVGNHTWRAFLVSTNAIGDVSFHFREVNEQEPGSTVYADRVVNRYPTGDVYLPSTGDTELDGEPKSFPTDGASNYIEFRYSDDTGSYTIGHAEFQNFNDWHDANLGDEVFTGTYAATSGVNQVAMVTTNAHMNTWSIPITVDANWNEDFYLSNYEDENYPKNEPFITHPMPHFWTGENGQFTDAKLVANTGVAKTNDAGIAWQMRGNSFGSIEYSQDSGPAGVDTVTFQAHLAQTSSFEDFSVWNGDGATSATNYIFMIPAVMSVKTGQDLAPGASMSVVACYRQHKGCYEFRVERAGNNGLQFSIYKWHEENYSITPELIGTRWYPTATFQLPNNDNTGKPNMFGMFISVGPDSQHRNATTIIGGLTVSASNPLSGYSGVNYRGICCADNSPTRFTRGSFGVLTRNCTGQFLTPQHYEGCLQTGELGNIVSPDFNPDCPMQFGYINDKPISFEGLQSSDQDKFEYDWDFVPGRVEVFTNKLYASYDILGLRAKADLKQTVGLYLRKRSSTNSKWDMVTNVTVTGYGFTKFQIPVQTTADSHVRLRTGDLPTDVTIWDITQTSWRGEDILNINGLSRDFIYTQGWVNDRTEDGITRRYITLQPKRALPTKPLSIRTPIMNGLGMIGFSYRDVQPGCELLVQIATNQVAANMNMYNQSIDEGTDVGEWQTIKSLRYEELVELTSRSVYVGIHDRENNPVRGIMRICISPDVVDMAASSSLGNFGAITITDIWAQDEPPIDIHCWRGGNLRTTGDAVDSEQRMYLPDGRLINVTGGASYGMSGALNNSLSDGVNGEITDYNTFNPYIQSPTFGTYTNVAGITTKAGIGMVRFRARLYDRYVGATPAHVSVYGVVDGADEDWGEALTNIVVASTGYKEYEYKVPGKKKLSAVRLVVDGVINPTDVDFVAQRVLFDDVTVSEKADATIGFEYARPFRMGLNADTLVDNILDCEQQPLCGESWGIQTKLKLQRIGNEVDTNRGFRVTFRYFIGDDPWGFTNWRFHPDVSKEIDLVQVGPASEYIFRSSASNPDSLVPPQDTPNTIVQYMVTVYYYMNGDDELLDQNIEWGTVVGNGWTNPEWYRPVDLNEQNLAFAADWSPYTILDTISPGRAWINEVNYNDGPRAQSGVKSSTNQFIEVAIPAGLDMTGWKIKITDMDYHTLVIATLGKGGIPGSKATANMSGDYDFLVIQSPATRDAGGIHGIDGKMMADGTWTSESTGGSFKDGTFAYGEPFQIGLYRPSGVMEHQFVVQGTNECWELHFDYLAAQYEGTNLVKELNIMQPETTRFYAGQDLARKADGLSLASIGVMGFSHGEVGGWKEGTTFTPGRLNDDQEALNDWFIHPNGTNVWVYARVDGPHLSQSIGIETNRDTFVIVPAGGSTNISYTIANWYQLDAVTINGVTNQEACGRRDLYTLELTNITETLRVVATERISDEVIDAGLDPADPYAPAVMRWLEAGVADGSEFASPGGPICLGKFKGLKNEDDVHDLTLKDMYWLDLDPTLAGWWFRGGISSYQGEKIYRKRKFNEDFTAYYTNYQVQVMMYIYNDGENILGKSVEPFAPKRLQGLGNEQSDDPAMSGQAWTSANFKVTAMLRNDNPHNLGFMPFRWFVFGPDSFYPADSEDPANPPFSATIEILDPFSSSSPGYSYGWFGYGMFPVLFRWSIDGGIQATTVEMLNKRSVYDRYPYEPWTPGEK